MLVVIICGFLAVVVAVLGAMIVLGTGAPPRPLVSIGKPFDKVDFRDLPELEKIPSRSGREIAFRQWQSKPSAPGSKLIVIAIHGSSATSSSLHPLAKALRAEGILVYAPDIRGHGGTGRRGDIDYAEQLDDDIADLVATVGARHPSAKIVLLGFSSGGGFALHVAASPLGKMLEQIVLLSPMLGIQAPTIKPEARAWAKAFNSRILGLGLLNKFGIRIFNHLNVLAFAIDPLQADMLTGYYSYLLMIAFGTSDYAADLRNASSPVAVLVGERDELFHAGLFAPTIAAIRPDVPVTVVPGLSHIEMITDPRAVPAIIRPVRGQDRGQSGFRPASLAR
jgi:alpha-beta hydrolase superfamily lysophospholipase